MKHFLQIILFALLLTSAISSCRSSRQETVCYSDTTTVDGQTTSSRLSSDDILSLITASREMALSGVRVEFFHPDSVSPGVRASPKSIIIDDVKATESAELSIHETAASDEQKTVNLSARSKKAMQHNSRSDDNALQPSGHVAFFSILGLLMISAVIIYVRSR